MSEAQRWNVGQLFSIPGRERCGIEGSKIPAEMAGLSQARGRPFRFRLSPERVPVDGKDYYCAVMD